MSRIIALHQLKPGDRFNSIPKAWYGESVVTESSGTRHVFSGFPAAMTMGRYGVVGEWTLKFLNNNIVNPPGVIYSHPDVKVRLLGTGLTKAMKRIKGRSY